MKSLKQFLPESFLTELADGPHDSISPVNGSMVYDQPDPRQLGLKEDADELNVGDPVTIIGNVEFRGESGEIVDFGTDKRSVVVQLGNIGRHLFHSSDVELAKDDELSHIKRLSGI